MTREAASPQTMVMTLLKGKCTMLAPQKTSGKGTKPATSISVLLLKSLLQIPRERLPNTFSSLRTPEGLGKGTPKLLCMGPNFHDSPKSSNLQPGTATH